MRGRSVRVRVAVTDAGGVRDPGGSVHTGRAAAALTRLGVSTQGSAGRVAVPLELYRSAPSREGECRTRGWGAPTGGFGVRAHGGAQAGGAHVGGSAQGDTRVGVRARCGLSSAPGPAQPRQPGGIGRAGAASPSARRGEGARGLFRFWSDSFLADVAPEPRCSGDPPTPSVQTPHPCCCLPTQGQSPRGRGWIYPSLLFCRGFIFASHPALRDSIIRSKYYFAPRPQHTLVS